MSEITCFKAYDVRGRVPEQLNTEIASRIALGFAAYLKPQAVVVGYDIRNESPELAKAVINGLQQAGADVVDIGLCGTEEIYYHSFANQAQGVDGGIMITASHNPKGDNGLKMVKHGARPLTPEDLAAIKTLAEENHFTPAPNPGVVNSQPDKTDYIQHLLGYINPNKLQPLRIVANPGNGGAGLVTRLLAEHLPVEIIHLHDTPDGAFPNGIPNPLLPENREVTRQAVIQHQADLGIAWDGDFDRCFFFDHQGRFIEGYYLVGLLAEAFLNKHPGASIIHDPRLTWNTIDIVQQHDGQAVQSKTGHAFIKQAMREHNAVYGGEMSAHHYFKDFGYCDSGMIPWLLVIEQISVQGKTLAQMVDERIAAYPCSGEINYTVPNAADILARIEQHYAPSAKQIDRTDGLSIAFADWRFNIRTSNTEPLLRLNVETRADASLVAHKQQELEALILQP